MSGAARVCTRTVGQDFFIQFGSYTNVRMYVPLTVSRSLTRRNGKRNLRSVPRPPATLACGFLFPSVLLAMARVNKKKTMGKARGKANAEESWLSVHEHLKSLRAGVGLDTDPVVYSACKTLLGLFISKAVALLLVSGKKRRDAALFQSHGEMYEISYEKRTNGE